MIDPNQIAIEALQDAVAAAPGNLALVRKLADLQSRLEQHDAAQATLRQALSRHPGNRELQLHLAQLYFRQGKDSHAAAIVETLIAGDDADPQPLLLHARLQQRRGDAVGAVATYRRAVDADESAADPELESLLGLSGVGPDEPGQRPDPSGPQGEWSLADDAEDLSPVPLERVEGGFDTVGGMDAVKEQIRIKIIYPMQHAEMYAAYGKKVGGGILMYGPPGCGKTHLARATAGEVKAGFLSVGISDVLDMWVGNSEKNLHRVFQQARDSKPCVLFFDEVDALGASRADMRRSAGRQLINQFLSELDGVDADNRGVLCLAATNTPWHLDSAFRRPGRFDRMLFVPPPDAAGREAILRIQLRGKPIAEVDLAKVAAKTADFSGADLSAVVDQCVEAKLQEAIATGLPKPITTADLLAAAKRVRPSTREWFATARNHALYANEGGVYDDILEYLKLSR